jgi:hypothetical protein
MERRYPPSRPIVGIAHAVMVAWLVIGAIYAAVRLAQGLFG